MANITLDDLAEMVGKGFNEVNTKIDDLRTELKGDIENLRVELTDEMARQFTLVHKRIDDLSKNMVFRDEFEDLKRDLGSLKIKFSV